MKKNILIIGGSGFVGKHMCDYLSKKKNNKIVATYFYNKPKVMSKNIIYHKVDLRNEVDIKKIFKKYNFKIVLMLAGKIFNFNKTIPQHNNEKIFDNILLHTNALKYSINNNVNKYLWISSSTGYPYIKSSKKFVESDFFKKNPPNSHFFSGEHSRFFEKIVQKISLKNNKTKIITIRPSEIFGEMYDFNNSNLHIIPYYIDKFFKNKVVNIEHNIHNKKNFIYVKELVEIIYRLVKKKSATNSTYNVCDSKNYSLKYILRLLINKIKNKKILIKPKYKKFQSVNRNFSNKKLIKFLNLRNISSFDRGLINMINYYK